MEQQANNNNRRGPAGQGGAQGGNNNFRGRGGAQGGNRRNNFPKPKGDGYKDKVLNIGRVTRVVAGGKRFRFQATIVIGDEKGKVGVGIGKGSDVVQSITKAKSDAMKHMITIQLDKRTIAHDVDAKYGSARIMIKRASPGHGLKAGGASRAVLALVGIKDITAKTLGSTTNKLTNAMATIKALKTLKKKTNNQKNEPVTSAPKSE